MTATLEQEFNVRHERIAGVLIDEQIETTLRWALALLSLGARVLCVRGVEREMYMGLCASMFEERATARALPRADFPSSFELPAMRAHLVRTFRKAGVELEDLDVAAHLVVFAATAAEARDLSRVVWLELCRATFVDAEADLARMKGPPS